MMQKYAKYYKSMFHQFISFIWLVLAGLVILLNSGCEVGPSYHYPQTEVPENWKTSQTQEPVQEDVCDWWEIFHDANLNALMQRALQNNHDLKVAIERVVEARAIAGIARADLYPQITLNPSYSNELYLTEAYATSILNQTGATSITGTPLFREHLLTYLLPINLSWEIDLWGRLKNIYNSAKYSAESEYDAYRNFLLILTTDLADSYFQARTFDKQIDLYLATIQTRKKALEINQSRYDAKLTDYEDVSQAALDLANVEAAYYDILRQRAKSENRIATLIGIPASEFTLAPNPLNGDPPVIPAGIPSEILVQRPDISQAERERASEHALIRSAYASFLPSFSLTGSIGFSSPDLKSFLSWRSRFWEIGANSVQTVFDGGRKLSNLELQWAKFKEADQAYREIVLEAFEEVEDALADVEWSYKESIKLAESVKAATKTYTIVSDRYSQGVIFYLAVVDSERDQLTAESNYNTVLGLRYSATIQLIKALGGDWSQN